MKNTNIANNEENNSYARVSECVCVSINEQEPSA